MTKKDESALAQILLGIDHSVPSPLCFKYNSKLLRYLRIEKEADSDGKT